MKVYGLTGSPGCGKSTVLEFFKAWGWLAVDADAICRRMHECPGGALHEALTARWGASVLNPDGSTNRTEVGRIVFGDSREREWLESMIYPVLKAEAKRQFNTMPADARVMFDIPLLFEKGYDEGLDGVITVWCSPEVQMERLLARGWSKEHAEARNHAHWPSDKKLEKADFGIINNGTLDELKEQCLILHNRLF